MTKQPQRRLRKLISATTGNVDPSSSRRMCNQPGSRSGKREHSRRPQTATSTQAWRVPRSCYVCNVILAWNYILVPMLGRKLIVDLAHRVRENGIVPANFYPVSFQHFSLSLCHGSNQKSARLCPPRQTAPATPPRAMPPAAGMRPQVVAGELARRSARNRLRQ